MAAMASVLARKIRSAHGTVALLGAFLSNAACSSDSSSKVVGPLAGDASPVDSMTSGPADASVIDHVVLPAASPGIGFDDLQFGRTTRKILAPAGRSGNLDLVNVDTEEITTISGFSTSADYASGHDFGTTSAVEGRSGTILATDRTTDQLHVVDVASKTLIASAALAAHPDYVRWVDGAAEAWLTEPDAGQIEILSVSAGSNPNLTQTATIPVAGGPESLVIDVTRGRAYTSSFVGTTYAIDLASHAIVETWKNGCTLSLGLALDEPRGFAFVGCPEGKIVVLDVAHGGTTLSTTTAGGGIDIVAYGGSTGHLYVPSPNDKTLTIFGVSSDATLTTLGIVEGAGAGVAADDRAQAWVTDPTNGALIRIRDGYPATK